MLLVEEQSSWWIKCRKWGRERKNLKIEGNVDRKEGGLANLLANEKAIKPLLRNVISKEDARLGRGLVSNDETASARGGLGSRKQDSKEQTISEEAYAFGEAGALAE